MVVDMSSRARFGTLVQNLSNVFAASRSFIVSTAAVIRCFKSSNDTDDERSCAKQTLLFVEEDYLR
jgi:hypothetical protein